jgi:iron complex outermembrane receptor protein
MPDPSSIILMIILCSLIFPIPYAQGAAPDTQNDLTNLSLEQLMNIEITSVSKKPELFSETPAAIYVITPEDIRRTGATSIPEALRMVPGLEVAKINGDRWAISARGFSDLYANYLLVLMDGRNLYAPLYGGVNWDEVDTMLEDIERIEVIRGPGATLWGANAVNGVINIITKHAKNTQGALISGGGGNEEQGFGSIRYGGKMGNDGYWRAYVKYFNWNDQLYRSGARASDRWDASRGGFRIDWNASAADSLTLLGDIYDGDAGERLTTNSLTRPYSSTFNDTLHYKGGDILGRWNRQFSATSNMQLQLYYDRTDRDDGLFHEVGNTFDIDFQHRFAWGACHDIVWGLGYNFNSEDIGNTYTVSFHPNNRDDSLFSSFIQDEITLIKDKLRFIIGSKLEHNDYTGFEVQPSARLLWTPSDRHTLWAAVSRAVKTPTYGNNNSRINVAVAPLGFIPVNVAMLPNTDFDSVEVIAYELGYRIRPLDRLFIDVATFYSHYDNQIDIATGNPFFEQQPRPPHLVIPLLQKNAMYGSSHGIEVASTWNVTNRWKLSAGYTWLKLQLHSHIPSSRPGNSELSSPQNQFNIRSYIDLPWNLEFDTALYYFDNVPRWNIPSYVRVDARLGWHPTKNLEVSVALQNIFDRKHPEFNNEQQIAPTELPRSGYVKLTWKY